MPTPTGPSSKRGLELVALACLAVAVILPLLVNTYARDEPRLAGIPFFFWYQFALIPVAAVLTFIAYRLVVAAERDRYGRRHRRDGDQS
jgi:uncharacterized membrane protein